MKKCNQCGTILPDDAVFCNKCGSDLRDPANFTVVYQKNHHSQKTRKQKNIWLRNAITVDTVEKSYRMTCSSAHSADLI